MSHLIFNLVKSESNKSISKATTS